MISGILFWISYTDIKEQKIKDKALLIFGVLALVKLCIFHWNYKEEYVAGALIVSVPMLLLSMFRPGAFGGGDIKLMAVAGIYLGKNRIIQATETACLLALVYVIWLLVVKKKNRKTTFPLGPFLCMGIGLCMLECIFTSW